MDAIQAVPSSAYACPSVRGAMSSRADAAKDKGMSARPAVVRHANSLMSLTRRPRTSAAAAQRTASSSSASLSMLGPQHLTSRPPSARPRADAARPARSTWTTITVAALQRLPRAQPRRHRDSHDFDAALSSRLSSVDEVASAAVSYAAAAVGMRVSAHALTLPIDVHVAERSRAVVGAPCRHRTAPRRGDHRARPPSAAPSPRS